MGFVVIGVTDGWKPQWAIFAVTGCAVTDCPVTVVWRIAIGNIPFLVRYGLRPQGMFAVRLRLPCAQELPIGETDH